MERQEFLKTLGLSFAAVCAGACLASCGGGDDTSTPNNSNPPPRTNPPASGSTVTANLSSLANIGSSITVSNVLFFRIAAANVPASFVAVQAQCTHQGGSLNWVQNQDLIRCSLHSASFEKNGTPISQPVGGGSVTPLRVYATTVDSSSVIATIS